MESKPKVRIEFAVNINTAKDFERIETLLKSKGVNLVSSDLEGKTIQLEILQEHKTISELGDVQKLQRFIEKETGFITVIKGLGSKCSAVAELRPASSRADHKAMGVVRLSQLEDDKCFVDGAIDGLSDAKGLYRNLVSIHEFGNLEGDSYSNIGDEMIMIEDNQKSSRDGKLSIRKTIPNCDVAGLIGRSIAVTQCDQNSPTASKKVISAGVIARSSTIDANKKQICSCSGKTLWEERLERSQDES